MHRRSGANGRAALLPSQGAPPRSSAAQASPVPFVACSGQPPGVRRRMKLHFRLREDPAREGTARQCKRSPVPVMVPAAWMRKSAYTHLSGRWLLPRHGAARGLVMVAGTLRATRRALVSIHHRSRAAAAGGFLYSRNRLVSAGPLSAQTFTPHKHPTPPPPVLTGHVSSFPPY
jgi:hypothetical protein